MADDTQLSVRTGDGDIISTDDIGGVKHQRVKVQYGDDGSATDVSDTNPLPIDDAGGSLTVDSVDLAAIAAAVDGTEMQVDVVDAGPTAVVLGTDVYAEATSQGHVMGAVRNDVLATLADADNEFAPLQVNDMGALWTHEEPINVDSGNSSVATLGIDAVFTGTAVDVLDYATVTVTMDASHDSATDGMSIQFSTDNVNWDDVYPWTYTAADGARRWQFPVTANYFRVVYTNGGTGQSHFRLQTLLHHTSTLTSIHRLVDSVHPDRSAEVGKSAIIAQAAGSGDFVPVQATAGGNLKQSLEEIDGALLGGGVEAGALLVTIASDSTGLLSVDDGGSPLDVSAATVTVDGSGVTQPVSAAALPLPAGAATDAKQLADGHNVTIPALDRTTDNVGAVDTTSAIMSDTTVVVPAFTVIDHAVSPDNTLVAAGTNKIRVLSLFLVSAGTVNVRFESGTGGTALTGQMNLVANTGFVLPYNPQGWFETASATLLNLELSAGISVDGALTYIDVA